MVGNSLIFADVLEEFIERDGRTPGQLSRKSAELSDGRDEIPRETITRWLRGQVKKPRSILGLISLSVVLRLTRAEADKLLMSAGHPSVSDLQEQAKDLTVLKLLDYWEDQKLSSSLHAAPFQAPPNLPTFVGRRAELKKIKDLVRHQSVGPIICLQGMAGVGKTALATYLVYQLRTYFADGVLWVWLGQTDTMSALQAIADSYNYKVSQYTDLGTRSAKVRELLATKKTLLILDDVVSDEKIKPLLPPTGLCTTVITTRQLDLSLADGNYRLDLQPFSEDKNDAFNLFSKVLGRTYARREQKALAEIANMLGHLPLAISIVANRLKHEPDWTTNELLQRMNQEKQRLNELQRGNRNVRLSFNLSYKMLPESLKQFFAILGVFESESFDLLPAAQISTVSSDIAMDYLRQLYNLSLVQTAPDNRYKLHPLLRDYSREHNEQADWEERFANFFIDYAASHEKDLKVLHVDANNIFLALEIAFDKNMKAELIHGANAFYSFLQTKGLYDRAQVLLGRAQSAAEESGDKQGLASSLHNLGHVAIRQGDIEQAKALYKEAVGLVEEIGSDKQQSALLTSLGALAYRQGHVHQARQYYDEAMVLAERTEDIPRIAALLTNLGLMAADQGETENAQSYYQRALRLTRQSDGSRQLTITLLQNLGALMDEQGDYAQARQYFREGLDLARNSGDPELTSRMLGGMGLVAYALENYAEAAAYFRRGLSLAEQSGLSQQTSRHSSNLGQVETQRKNYKQAELHFNKALSLSRQNGFESDICVIQNHRGESFLSQKKLDEALKVFSEAHQISQSIRLQKQIAKSLYGLARIAATHGNVAEARRLGRESQALFATVGHKRASEVMWWLKELPGEVE